MQLRVFTALIAWTGALATTAFAESGGGARAGGKREFNFFPIVGGDSDVGFGLGQVSNVARLGATEGSFRWRLEEAAFVTFKVRDGSFIVPFLDIYALLTVPSFGPGGRFRLELRPSYTDERTLGYYGMGNASPYLASISDEQREYRRIHPTLAGGFACEFWTGSLPPSEARTRKVGWRFATTRCSCSSNLLARPKC